MLRTAAEAQVSRPLVSATELTRTKPTAFPRGRRRAARGKGGASTPNRPALHGRAEVQAPGGEEAALSGISSCARSARPADALLFENADHFPCGDANNGVCLLAPLAEEVRR